MISCKGIPRTKSASPRSRGLRQNVGVLFPVPDLNWWPWAQSKRVVGTVDGVRLVGWYGFFCCEFEVTNLEKKTILWKDAINNAKNMGHLRIFEHALLFFGGDNKVLGFVGKTRRFVMIFRQLWKLPLTQTNISSHPPTTFYASEEGLEHILLCKRIHHALVEY